ncbi:MAG TPA: endonuclease/exonuclease/phosphatase family protein [Actinomycetota bacterium]|nr:endonuclease/exonuclease/phosphatase family protein [Actinomycetota bacterium]
MRLRVMVWNVHGFRAGVAAIGDAVASAEPDVLILNETRYLGFRLRRFSRRLGLSRAAGTGLWRPIPNAILVRPPWRIVRHEKVVLPRSRRTIRRGVVTATIGRAGSRLQVTAVHLGLSGGERLEHARLLTDALAGARPLILGGDLNEGPDGPAASWIGSRYFDVCATGCGSTFPSAAPRARIDYLFVSDGVRVERAEVGEPDHAPLSDHLPVVADLSVG